MNELAILEYPNSGRNSETAVLFFEGYNILFEDLMYKCQINDLLEILKKFGVFFKNVHEEMYS